MERHSQSLMETYEVVSNGVEANQTSGPPGNQTVTMCRTPATEIQYRKGPWKPEEDTILKNYIRTHGEGLWSKIPERTNLLRSGKSCRLRWKNHLSTEVTKKPLTPEEEDKIIQLQSRYGNRWSIISAYLPGRTDNDVKNFWNSKDSKLRKRRRYMAPPFPSLSQSVVERCKIHNSTASSVGVPIVKDLSWYIPQTVENSYFSPQFQNMHVSDHRQFAGLYLPTNRPQEMLQQTTREFRAQPVFPVDSTFDPFGNNIIPSMASTSSSVVGTNFSDFGISMTVTDPSIVPSSSNHYNMCQIAGGDFPVPCSSFNAVLPNHPPSVNAAGNSSSFNADQFNANVFPGYNGPVMTESASNQLANADKDDLDIDLILSNLDLDEFSGLLDELDPAGVPVDESIENIDAVMMN